MTDKRKHHTRLQEEATRSLQAGQSQLSDKAIKIPGSHFQAHEEREGDWKQETSIYWVEITKETKDKGKQCVWYILDKSPSGIFIAKLMRYKVERWAIRI